MVAVRYTFYDGSFKTRTTYGVNREDIIKHLKRLYTNAVIHEQERETS